MALVKVVCMVAAVIMYCVVACTPKAEAAVTCGQVVNNVEPCITYVAYGAALNEACCSGVRSLYNMAKTTPDRQSVCSCLKQAIAGISYTSTSAGLAAGLPSKCGVSIPYKISPQTDCKSIK